MPADAYLTESRATIDPVSTELVTTFMATLVIMGLLGVAASFVNANARQSVASAGLHVAAAVAVAAALSSLYLSEIANFTPCRYCWWQRIFMYPLAIILLIAAFRREISIRRYALPLAFIGLGVAARHIWLQSFPDDSGTCGISAPCSSKLVEAFGFLTIPQMTGMCFVLIIVLLARARA